MKKITTILCLTLLVSLKGMATGAIGFIGDYIWNDINGDGLQNEPASAGINGVVVELYWESVPGSGVYTFFDTYTSTNDANGNPGYYKFEILRSGNFKVLFPTTVGGMVATVPNYTAATDLNSDLDGATGYSPIFNMDITLAGITKHNSTIDAGYILPVAHLSGNVFNDPNAGNVDNSTGTTNLISSGVFAYLLDASNKVVAKTIVNTDGTYSLPIVSSGNYTVEISSESVIVGNIMNPQTLPAGWVNTGDFNGLPNTGKDGTVNGTSASFTVAATDVANINFGIQQPPTAVSSTMPTQANNGYSIPVPPTQFSGTDYSGGTVQSILITAFPQAGGVDVASITINGVKYNSAAAFNAAFPTGATISANSSGNPLQAINVQTVLGNTNSIIIPYVTIDNGGAVSPSATVTIPIATLLPVNFGSIAATVNGCSAVVGFSTLSELNTDRFVVESSIDGANWNAISTLAAKPGTTGGASYSFVDAGANYGTNYYRIKAVDKDGHFVYSATVTAKVGCSKVVVTAVPNPFANVLKVGLTRFAAGAYIQILSPEGRVLISEKMGSGASTATINTAALPSGPYLVKVTDSKNSSTQKLIKL